MFRNIIKTGNSYSLLLLRVALGTVMLGHGLQKAFGLFNGFGWTNTINYFTGTVGLPSVLAALIILIESLGAALLILGVFGRINAALLFAVIMGAFFVDHIHNGFFMNWFGNQKGEGFEFDILFVAMAITLVINGSGKFSVDYWFSKKLSVEKNTETKNEELYSLNNIFS